MRWFILSFCLISTAVAQQSLSETREVYSRESKTSAPNSTPVKPQFPVDAAIISAEYHLKPGPTAASGTATFEVQSFRDGPQAIPLIGESAIVESFEPKEAVLLTRDGHYALILDGKKRMKVTLRFGIRTTAIDGGTAAELKICPAVSSTLELEDIPEGRTADVEGAVPSGTSPGRLWRLPRTTLLRVTEREPAKPLPPPITMPAVVREADSEMRVVTDGAFLNKMKWRIRHQAPLVWSVDLPEDCQIVSSSVGGNPASPSRVNAKTIEFRIPPPNSTGETIVEASYTGKANTFDPVRGQISLTLPVTPLLVESLQWKLSFPPAYEIVAAQGNVDFLPGSSAGKICLGKELCRNEAPGVLLFYQKSESKKATP